MLTIQTGHQSDKTAQAPCTIIDASVIAFEVWYEEIKGWEVCEKVWSWEWKVRNERERELGIAYPKTIGYTGCFSVA